MQAPTQITPAGLSDYLDVITRAVFQSGMSWRVVEAKWAGFREAFAGFDPAVVAAYTDDDVERLAADKGIIRNAQAMLALEDEPGGFVGWLRGRGDFEATVAALRGEFRFLGDMGSYYVLYVVGENVPTHEEWMATHPQYQQQ